MKRKIDRSSKNPNRAQELLAAQVEPIKPVGNTHISNQNQTFNIKKEALGPNTDR